MVTNEGDHWKVEKCPKGCDDFPEDPANDDLNTFTSCFATTYNSCSKEQIIDLKKEGAVSQIMDLLQPKITVSEWFEPFFHHVKKWVIHTYLINELKPPTSLYENDYFLQVLWQVRF